MSLSNFLHGWPESLHRGQGNKPLSPNRDLGDETRQRVRKGCRAAANSTAVVGAVATTCRQLSGATAPLSTFPHLVPGLHCDLTLVSSLAPGSGTLSPPQTSLTLCTSPQPQPPR